MNNVNQQNLGIKILNQKNVLMSSGIEELKFRIESAKLDVDSNIANLVDISKKNEEQLAILISQLYAVSSRLDLIES